MFCYLRQQNTTNYVLYIGNFTYIIHTLRTLLEKQFSMQLLLFLLYRNELYHNIRDNS